MKKNLILTTILISYALLLFSQLPQPNFVLKDPIPGNETRDYIARDFVSIIEGYSYYPEQENHLLAKTDPLMIFPPEDIGGGPNPDDDGVVGAIPGSLSVSPSGSATYSIPIEVPPGISGMTPEISLVYNSMGADGVMGPGWAVAGLSVVSNVRPAQFYSNVALWSEQDNLMSYFNNNNFALNGQRLIMEKEGETYQYGEYRLEQDDFTRVLKNPWGIIGEEGGLFFTAEKKSGLQYEYGKTDDSRQWVEVVGAPVSQHRSVLNYFVNKITDRFGNDILYTYDRNPQTGEIYIDKISYGNGAEVIFEYAPREDPIISRLQHHNFDVKFMVKQTLKSITCKYDGSVYRKYNLTYEPRGTNNVEHLNEVVLEGRNNEKYNKTVFEWTDIPIMDYDFDLIEDELPQSEDSGGKPYSGDFDGDGLNDLCISVTNESAYKNDLVFYKNNGDGTFAKMFSIDGHPNHYNQNIFVADYNGDGISDVLMGFVEDVNDRYIADLYLFKHDFTYSGHWAVFDMNPGNYIHTVGDMDGDGLADVVKGSQHSYGCSDFGTSNPDQPFKLKNALSLHDDSYNGYSNYFFADFNGNGRMDGLKIGNSEYPTDHLLYLNKMDDFDDSPIEIHQVDMPIVEGDIVRLGDFNGDLITDICVIKDRTKFSIYQGFGAGFIKTLENQEYPLEEYANNEGVSYFFTGDFNGDGLTDIYRNDYYQYLWLEAYSEHTILLSNCSGSSFTKVNAEIEQIPWPYASTLVSDFNSDGISELFCNKSLYTPPDPDDPTVFDFVSNFQMHEIQEQFNAITSVTNGLGVKTNIDYKHMLGNDRKTGINPEFPIAYYPGILTVVDRMYNYDKNYVSSTYYNYEGARVHVGGKGFLGFLKTTSKTWLKDEGSIVTEAENEIDTDFFYFWPKTTKTWIDDGSSIIDLTETTNVFDNKKKWDEVNNRWKRNHYPYLKETITKEYESDGSFIKSTCTNNTYNDWGDLTSSHIMSSDNEELDLESAESSFDFRIINTNIYKPVDAEMKENWILGRMTTAYAKTIAPNQDEKNRITTFDYYTNGLLKWEKSMPWGDRWIKKEYFYYGNGNIARSETTGADIEKRIHNTFYDENGRFINKSQNALGHEGYKTYDQISGNVLSKTDPNDLMIEMQYDGFDRLYETTNPDNTIVVSVLRWVMDDDEDAPEAIALDPIPLYYSWSQSSGGPVAKTYYDKFGRELRSVTTGFDNKTIYIDTEYNNNSTVKNTTQPYFKGSPPPDDLLTTYKYDEINRPWKVIESGNRETATTYNGLSQTITNPAGQTNTKTNNAAGWLISTTDANGKQNTYDYYSNGKLKTITDPKNNVTELDYDVYGNRTYLKDPDLGVSEYTYFVDGKLKHVDKANHNSADYTYDLMGRMKTRTEKEGFTEWFYDEAENGLGKISHIVGSEVSEKYYYDELTRLKQKNENIKGETFSVFFNYDVFGREKTFEYPSGYTIKNKYDNNSYLKAVEDCGSGKTLWLAKEMNAKGQLEQIELGNGLNTYYEFYDETGLLKEIETPGIQHMGFDWFNIPNLKSRENYLIGGLKEDFEYDDLNRLRYVTNNGVVKQEMQYDEIGNIIFKSDVGEYEYESIQPHAVSRINGNNLPISSLFQDIHYTSFDKIEHITEGESTLEIMYGILHQRKMMVQNKADSPTKVKYYIGGGIYEKIIEGNSEKSVHYLSAGNGLFAIYTEDNKWDKDGEDSKERQTEIHKEFRYVLADHLGSIQYLTDEDGRLVEEYSYDAWGKRRNPVTWEDFEETPILNIDRGFTGHEHLDLFELVNMNGRIYDPVIGRFLSADPYMQMPEHTQGLNRYSYCFNNPLSHTDPSGFSVDDAFFPMWAAVVIGTIATFATAGMAAPAAVALIGFAAGFTGAVVGAAMNGASFGQAMMAGLQGGAMGAIMASMSFGIGQAFSPMLTREAGQLVLNMKNAMVSLGQAGAHGIVNGGFRVIQGGRFEHGFMSGFFASLSGSGVGMIKTAPLGLYAVVGAATGGTAEALGGGKFANGAVTGTFVGMFNHGMHGGIERPDPTEFDMMVEVTSREELVNEMRFYSEKYGVEIGGVELTLNGETKYYVLPANYNGLVNDATTTNWDSKVLLPNGGKVVANYHTHLSNNGPNYVDATSAGQIRGQNYILGNKSVFIIDNSRHLASRPFGNYGDYGHRIGSIKDWKNGIFTGIKH